MDIPLGGRVGVGRGRAGDAILLEQSAERAKMQLILAYVAEWYPEQEDGREECQRRRGRREAVLQGRQGERPARVFSKTARGPAQAA